MELHSSGWTDLDKVKPNEANLLPAKGNVGTDGWFLTVSTAVWTSLCSFAQRSPRRWLREMKSLIPSSDHFYFDTGQKLDEGSAQTKPTGQSFITGIDQS